MQSSRTLSQDQDAGDSVPPEDKVHYHEYQYCFDVS